ncbi:TRAP transporter small permease subunit [bacterium]|nr:TRAP transporter small permease subunit [bacterium]
MLERVLDAIGRWVSWLVVAVVIVCFAGVTLRYGFDLGWVALQESYQALHAAAFLLAGAWVLRRDEHVRVDVWYRGRSARTRAWVNLLGALLLLMPVCGFIVWASIDYVAAAWRVLEGSRQPGGLPGVFVIKTLIPVSAALVLLAGVSQALYPWRVLRGGEDGA